MTPDRRTSERPPNAQQQLFSNPWTKFGLIVGGVGAAIGIIAAIGAPILALIVSKGRATHIHSFHSSWSPGQPVTAGALPAIIGGVLSTLIPLAILALVLIKVILPMLRQNRLLKNGTPARATIVTLTDTGMTVNNNPRIRLELDIAGPSGRYRATTSAVVSRLVTARYVPGTVVDVMVDANNPQQVALVDVAAPAQAGTTAGIERRLKEIDEYNQRVGKSGEPARATIIKAEPMNVMVNGNNPAITFILKVHPVGAEPFLAEAAGVIGEQAVQKYQPGCEVYVRFEATDKTRVALDHS